MLERMETKFKLTTFWKNYFYELITLKKCILFY